MTPEELDAKINRLLMLAWMNAGNHSNAGSVIMW